MKKSLLALAAIATVSGSAFAQSSVTIYGRVDQSLAQQADAPKNREVRNGSGNRLGFRGVEDLGGGLKAFFQIEHRFNADDGTTATTFWDGKSFVGVRTTAGDFYLGREDNPSYALVQLPGDPFGTDTVAANTTIINGGGIATTRYANSLNYRGTFSGLTFGAQVSERAVAGEYTGVKAQQIGEDRPYSVAAAYTGGPFFIGVGFENPADAEAQWATATVGYNFGPARLSFLFGDGKTAADQKMRSMLLGLTAPLGNGELKASYGVRENKTTSVKGDKQIGLGYHYALSKRTTIYADFVNEKRDGIDATNNEKNGYDFGVKHNF